MAVRAFGVVFLLAAALPAAAQAGRDVLVPGAEVRATAPGPDTLAAAPGETVGFGVRLEERGGVGHAIRLEMGLPDGWSPLLVRPSFHLGAGASTLQIASVRVPPDALAGLYPVRVVVRGQEGWATEVRKMVRVEARQALTVLLVDVPRFVVAGAPYGATALVRNGGNVPAEVVVVAETSLRHDVEPAERRLLVEPLGTAEVALVVQTEPRGRAATDRLRVAARDVEAPLTGDEARVSVEVVPAGRGGEAADTWPLVGMLSAVGTGGEVAPVLGLEGAVPLGGGRLAELRLDGVGPQTASVFRRQPEAWARYAGPGLEAHVGTGSYVLSPVTSSATYGVGGLGRVARGGLDAAVVVRRPWLAGVETGEGTDVGLGLGARPVSWVRVGANVLTAGGTRGGTVATARVETVGLEGLGLEAEAGVVAAEAPRPVYGLRAVGRWGPLAVAATADRRDARQPGRLTTIETETAQATLALGGGAAAWAQGRAVRTGESRLALAAPGDEATGRGGLRWRGTLAGVTLGAEAGARLRHVERADGASTLTLGEGALDARWGPLRVSGDLGVGRVRVSDGVVRRAWSASGGVGLSGHGQSLALTSQWSEGASMWSALPSRQWSATAEVALALGRFRLRGAATAGRFEAAVEGLEAPVVSETASGRVAVAYALRDGRELAVEAVRYGSGAYDATHLRATVRVPVDLPLPAGVGRPEIHGRLVDSTGAGVAGVLLYHGEDRVVTDGDGAFAFATTAEGGYLFLDRATLGADRTPRTPFPFLAVPGRPVEVEVVSRSALRGALRQVAVLGAGARTDTVLVGGVPGVVVEAEGEGQRHRAVTDARGRFTFGDLPSGTYTLRVVAGRLPEGHRLEREALTVEVEGEAALEWRVVPERREIRMMGGARRAPSGGPVRVVSGAPGVRSVAPAPGLEAPPAAASAEPVRAALAPADESAVETRPPLPPRADPNPDRPTLHHARIGEGLLGIGRRYGLSASEIRTLNPGVGDHLTVGQPVRLRDAPVGATVHLARPGEHLLSIGRRYGLTPAEVRALNPGLGDHLAVGQPVRVGGAPELPATHRVEPGEYLLSIARRYGLSGAEVRALNPGLGDDLRVGQTVRLRPATGLEAPTARPSPRTRASDDGRW